MIDKTNETIDTREVTHGSFQERAGVNQRIRQAIFENNPCDLKDDRVLSLIMIADKISRIVCGNADTHDHWLDISGYAMLVANRLEIEGK